MEGIGLEILNEHLGGNGPFIFFLCSKYHLLAVYFHESPAGLSAFVETTCNPPLEVITTWEGGQANISGCMTCSSECH